MTWPCRMYIYRCLHCCFSTPWTFSFRHHVNTKHILHYTDCSIHLEPCVYSMSKFQTTLQNVKIHGRRNFCSPKHAQKLGKYEERLKENGRLVESPEQDSKISTKRICGQSVKVKWFPCRDCLYKTKRQSHLDDHVQAKHTHPSQRKYYSCGDCLHRSKYRTHLHRHMMEVHLKRPIADWHYCDKCTFKSKRKGNVVQHVATRHTNPSKIKWYQCEKCPFKSKWHSHLKTHLVSKHSDPDNIPWFFCAQCPYKAKRKSNIRQHILSRHDPSNPRKRRLYFSSTRERRRRT